MCGIAGYVGGAPPELLAAMVRALKHRVEPGVGLGMTRLAIIDLVTGRQPMSTADSAAWIVYNGEIYNFRDLQAELERRGHVFRTRSDTEVLLAAWEAFGEACVERLRGMFAFALWDRRRRRLLLARDRLGKKPLYYWYRDGLFLFASEPKALLCHPAIARTLDWEGLRHYLAFGYTPAARSIFADIAKLPPAHTAVLADGRLALSRYWTLPAGSTAMAERIAPADAPRLVRHELREAVRLRLESDVPLGVFLSGGIDSSAVVASMREVTGQRIRTFTVGFGASAASYDELPYARMVARRFETEHHEEILEPVVADLLPTIVHHFDEPFADSSAIPTFVVAQATARHVKVVLSGIGGDETFAGYPDQPLPDRYLGWTRFFSDADLERLATPALRQRWRGRVDDAQRRAFAGLGHDDPVDGAFRIDLSAYLPDDLLVMADRMSMAHSLELRAPFCDHHVVELSHRVAPAAKLPRLRLKGLLKAAFADVLPREILSRRKQGFMIPLARWLRTDLRSLMDDLLSPDRVKARGLFEAPAVDALRREHLVGRRSHADRLWTLMMAELWMRQYLDARGLWSARE